MSQIKICMTYFLSSDSCPQLLDNSRTVSINFLNISFLNIHLGEQRKYRGCNFCGLIQYNRKIKRAKSVANFQKMYEEKYYVRTYDKTENTYVRGLLCPVYRDTRPNFLRNKLRLILTDDLISTKKIQSSGFVQSN